MQAERFVSCAPQIADAGFLLYDKSLDAQVLQPCRDLQAALTRANDYDLPIDEHGPAKQQQTKGYTLG